MEVKILLAQINSTIGDFEGNFQKMRQALAESRDADLVVFPECSLCGYPQRDLLDYRGFAAQAEIYSKRLIETENERSFIFGNIERNTGSGKPFWNVALFADNGRLIARYAKRLLPTYDVFDEDRFFEPARTPCLLDFKGEKLALTICEDIWGGESGTELHNRYNQNPLEDSSSASIIINLSASPFESTKVHAKREMLQGISKRHGAILVYTNSVGANDDLIFDGRSYVWSASGQLLAEGSAFKENLLMVDTESTPPMNLSPIDDTKNIYDALLLGIRDYCEKQNFTSIVLGVSGGIDSALVACLAADAIGAENTVGVLMPSRFTSAQSNFDAIELSRAMQNPIHLFSIEEMFQAGLKTMGKAFEGLAADVTEENMQARIRAFILMSLSNKFGHLLLTTGNKSELAVGYCTLYGDMCGGLAPLSDIYKTQVYDLAREANRRSQRIPESAFTKAPSAELRANQKDQDTLPPYERLDEILKLIIEKCQSKDELLAQGYPSEEITKILGWISRSEYKRNQMPLGLKISSKAFGIGRRVPLVQKFY